MSTHADSKPWTVPALAEAKRNGQKLVMLTAYDAGFARSMRAHIEAGIADGVGIPCDHFKHVGRFKRAGYETAYFFYKLVMRIVAIGYA